MHLHEQIISCNFINMKIYHPIFCLNGFVVTDFPFIGKKLSTFSKQNLLKKICLFKLGLYLFIGKHVHVELPNELNHLFQHSYHAVSHDKLSSLYRAETSAIILGGHIHIFCSVRRISFENAYAYKKYPSDVTNI